MGRMIFPGLTRSCLARQISDSAETDQLYGFGTEVTIIEQIKDCFVKQKIAEFLLFLKRYSII